MDSDRDNFNLTQPGQWQVVPVGGDQEDDVPHEVRGDRRVGVPYAMLSPVSCHEGTVLKREEITEE
jgi:hypothetical protein